ncbi:MAG: hypothetical protein E7264_12155 [Lachnospiraceae bacterium]|nr:hypothetical protein [Lachnospiraceae bacterium]
MRDRLVELLKNARSLYAQEDSGKTMYEEFADYLLANGVFVPPCKVGQTVYLIKDGFIERCEVEGIHYTRRSNYVRIRPYHQEYLGNWSVYYKPSISSFGKTVFLTKEEAEQALKGGEGDGTENRNCL